MPRKSRAARLWYRLEHTSPDGTVETSEARQYPDMTELMRVTEIWSRASMRAGATFTWYANESDRVKGWRAVLKLEIRKCIGGGLVLYPLPIGRSS